MLPSNEKHVEGRIPLCLRGARGGDAVEMNWSMKTNAACKSFQVLHRPIMAATHDVPLLRMTGASMMYSDM
jgi:hypothetical protein